MDPNSDNHVRILRPPHAGVSMSYRQNSLFDAWRSTIGTGVRMSRTIPQCRLATFTLPVKPFIVRFCTDAETSTQTPDVGILGHRQINKFSSLIHNGTFFPWHDRFLSFDNHHANIPVTHVSEQVLPMSQVYTRLCQE
jgi:hypothetical protein